MHSKQKKQTVKTFEYLTLYALLTILLTNCEKIDVGILTPHYDPIDQSIISSVSLGVDSVQFRNIPLDGCRSQDVINGLVGYYFQDEKSVAIQIIPPDGATKLFVEVGIKISKYLLVEFEDDIDFDTGYYEVDIEDYSSLRERQVFTPVIKMNEVAEYYDGVIFKITALIDGCLSQPIEYHAPLKEEVGIPEIWREKVGEVNDYLKGKWSSVDGLTDIEFKPTFFGGGTYIEDGDVFEYSFGGDGEEILITDKIGALYDIFDYEFSGCKLVLYGEEFERVDRTSNCSHPLLPLKVPNICECICGGGPNNLSVEVHFWINAFIPHNIPNYTQEAPSPPWNGETVIPYPFTWCAFTDQRDYSNDFDASHRMQSSIKVKFNNHTSDINFLPSHDIDHTIEIRCVEGTVTCQKLGDKDKMKWKQPTIQNSTLFKIDLTAKANNPCTGGFGSPIAIDYKGTLTLNFATREGSFRGKVDKFPAFEAYVVIRNNSPIAIDKERNSGNEVTDLFGPARKSFAGSFNW